MTLEKLVNKYPDIEVVMAGSIGIDLKNYDIPFNYENLGSLTIEETSKLYQICDIGLCFSATNLSFLPLELMASGCLVITNKGETTEWLLKDGFNCLLSDPVVSLLLEKFDIAIHNYELRKEIITNGLKTTHLTSWEDEFERVHNFILKGEYQNPVYVHNHLMPEKAKEIPDTLSYRLPYDDGTTVLQTLFNDIRSGIYIDVGAGDADIGSITKSFYDSGWHGINIEPIPHLCKKLSKERHRDINLELAIGSFNGTVSFHEVLTGWALSTIDFDNANIFSQKHEVYSYTVQQQTLDEICAKYKNEIEVVHFLKVDVEGD